MSAVPVPADQAHTLVGDWLRNPNIVMLDTATKRVAGRETGQQAIIVGVIEKKPPRALTELDFPVPPRVEVAIVLPDGSVRQTDMPTDVIETGAIFTRGLVQRLRPTPGGFMIAAAFKPPWPDRRRRIEPPKFGTLGATTYYRNQRCLLSNAHVLGSHSGSDHSRPGSLIYQPEPDYHSDPDWDILGTCDGMFEVIHHIEPVPLERELFFNWYDFAWSHVPPGSATNPDLTSHRVSGIYDGEAPLEFRREPVVGETVRWIGMSTGVVQESKIRSVRATTTSPTKWPAPSNMVSYWARLIRVDTRSTTTGEPVKFVGGDSGAALIAKADNKIVGLMTMATSKPNEEPMIFATRIPPDEPDAAGDDDPEARERRQRMLLRIPGPTLDIRSTAR